MKISVKKSGKIPVKMSMKYSSHWTIVNKFIQNALTILGYKFREKFRTLATKCC